MSIAVRLRRNEFEVERDIFRSEMVAQGLTHDGSNTSIGRDNLHSRAGETWVGGSGFSWDRQLYNLSPEVFPKKKATCWECEMCDAIHPLDEYNCSGCGAPQKRFLWIFA